MWTSLVHTGCIVWKDKSDWGWRHTMCRDTCHGEQQPRAPWFDQEWPVTNARLCNLGLLPSRWPSSCQNHESLGTLCCVCVCVFFFPSSFFSFLFLDSSCSLYIFFYLLLPILYYIVIITHHLTHRGKVKANGQEIIAMPLRNGTNVWERKSYNYNQRIQSRTDKDTTM